MQKLYLNLTIRRAYDVHKSPENVCHMHNMCLIITDFPEPSLVLASMFYHFKPNNDYANRCILTQTPRVLSFH
jgi:hypothetical protein